MVYKAGYRLFAEVVAPGKPVPYVRRGDWPEEPCLVKWLHSNGQPREILLDQLMAGALARELEYVIGMSTEHCEPPTGAEEAARTIADVMLGVSSVS
jgi:hypothetical protein